MVYERRRREEQFHELQRYGLSDAGRFSANNEMEFRRRVQDKNVLATDDLRGGNGAYLGFRQ